MWDVDNSECIQTLEGHGAAVYCIAALPDGRVVSGSGDKMFKVWTAA